MNSKYIIGALAVVLLAVVISIYSQPVEPVVTKQVEFELGTYLAAGMPEQDVFVEDPEDPDQICRLSPDEDMAAYLDRPVFAAEYFVRPDPYQVGPNPIGSYPKGAELGFTMAEWQAAAGSGVYTVAGYEAQIEASFQNLVPNGVYTLWCAEFTSPPTGQMASQPCGAYDAYQHVFIADAQGNAEASVHLRALPESTAETVQVVAAVYHSDGSTYGPYPGDLGFNSHVQLLGFIPTPADTAWQVLADTDAAIAQNR